MQLSTFSDWLDEDYMQKRLRVFYGDANLKVIKLWSKAATGKGENFVGVITRIYVEYEQTGGIVKQSSYLLKESCPEGEPQAAVFLEYNVYDREMDMYEFVLPKMSQLLREVGITDKMHADAIAVDREHGVIILEDLSPLNYKNADRIKKLDLNHTHLALDSLSKFHAAVFVLEQRHPELLAKNFDRSFFSRGPDGYKKVFGGFYKALVRYVESKPELKERYHAKMEGITNDVLEYAGRSYDIEKRDFPCLVHGDFWTTNFMFQYDDEGKPTTVLPIDFQFSVRASPGNDLHYFFNTSLQEDVFDRESELIQYYYYALRKTLKQLQYKGDFLTLHEFQLQFERRRFVGKFLPHRVLKRLYQQYFTIPIGVISLAVMPMMTYQGTDFSGFSDFYEDTPEAKRFQNKLYENKDVQYVVDKRLPLYDFKGLLEVQWGIFLNKIYVWET